MKRNASYDACTAIVKTLPYDNGYDYGKLHEHLTSPPDHPEGWEGHEDRRREWVVRGVVSGCGWGKGTPDNILYSLCQWVDEALTPSERAEFSCGYMAHVATVDLWELDVVMKLWGEPGTLSNAIRLGMAIADLYRRAMTTPVTLRRHIYCMVRNLIDIYQEDLARPDDQGTSVARYIIRTIHRASHVNGRQEYERVSRNLKTIFPSDWVAEFGEGDMPPYSPTPIPDYNRLSDRSTSTSW